MNAQSSLDRAWNFPYFEGMLNTELYLNTVDSSEFSKTTIHIYAHAMTILGTKNEQC